MALEDCNECGKQFSTRASQCPHCGAKRTTLAAKGCLTMVLGLFGLFVIIGLLRPDDAPPNQPASVGIIGSKQILAKLVFACSTQEPLEQIEVFVSQKDFEAANTEMEQALVSRECFEIGKGRDVLITDVSVFHGHTRFRPIGTTKELWASTAGLKFETP